MRNKNLQLLFSLLLLFFVVNPVFAFQGVPGPGLQMPIDGFISFFIAIGALLGFRFFNRKEK